MKSTLLALTLLLPLATFGQKKVGEAATIDSVTVEKMVKPGGEVTAVVKVKLEKGYHTHSNKPSDPQFIATTIAAEAPAGVKVGKIGYPAGKSHKVAGLKQPLSVYEEEFALQIPLTLSKDVVLPATVPATITYQACQGAVCYPPRKLKFEIKLNAKAE
jgi:DsbC/DsbD-like thiol-disulfide interchange protein